MKAFIFSTNFLLTLFLTLPLALCSSDDQTEEDDNTPLETIEIIFDAGFETDCGEVWTVGDVNLSISPFTEDEIDPNGFNADRIGNCPFYRFQNLDGQSDLFLAPGLLEIDFSNIEEPSSISIEITDSGGSTRANLYADDDIIASERATPDLFERERLVFDAVPDSATHIRVWSFEGFVHQIIIER